MSKEGSKLSRAMYYVDVGRDLRPKGLQSRVKQLGLSIADENLALNLLRDKRNRLSASAALRMPDTAISPLEQAGVIFFVSLVNAIDDHIDTNRTATSALREEISAIPVGVISAGELTARVVDMLPAPKAASVEQFMEHMTQEHESDTSHPAGSYGFQDALNYRLRTTMPYIRTVTNLIGLQPSRQSDIDHAVMTIQYADDAKDVATDMEEQSLNMFVGMAKDNGELWILENALNEPGLRSRDLIRKPLITHAQYGLVFDKELAQFSSRLRGQTMRVISKLYQRHV